MIEWLIKLAKYRDFYGPFSIANDVDYYDDLRKRFTKLNNVLNEVNADKESVQIAKKYTDKVCEAIRDYYKGHVSTCHQRIENLVKRCMNHPLAVADLSESKAFPGKSGEELQLFRARCLENAKVLTPKDMLHLPFNLRSKSGNYRFSIPGVISLYLANTSYGCWIEMGKPSEHDFYVSPVLLDGKQRVFNLAVRAGDYIALNDGKDDYIHCWLKLFILMIATSYNIEEGNRSFKSEYIISQSIMLACKKLGIDGIAYYSKRVEIDTFGAAAINLALFAEYEKGQDYGSICEHLIIDQPMNYQLFRQLNYSATYKAYSLRSVSTQYITNVGNYKRQYSYRDTEFYRFDEHLFARWDDKDSIDFGNVPN